MNKRILLTVFIPEVEMFLSGGSRGFLPIKGHTNTQGQRNNITDGFFYRCELCVSVCVLPTSKWKRTGGSWMPLMTTSVRFACWRMKCLIWTQRRPSCWTGTPTSANTQLHVSDVFLSLSGWCEAALRALCPSATAHPAPWGASRPPEPSSLSPHVVHASSHASATCTPWSVWRRRASFDATSPTWKWSRQSSTLLLWYDYSNHICPWETASETHKQLKENKSRVSAVGFCNVRFPVVGIISNS